MTAVQFGRHKIYEKKKKSRKRTREERTGLDVVTLYRMYTHTLARAVPRDVFDGFLLFFIFSKLIWTHRGGHARAHGLWNSVALETTRFSGVHVTNLRTRARGVRGAR